MYRYTIQALDGEGAASVVVSGMDGGGEFGVVDGDECVGGEIIRGRRLARLRRRQRGRSMDAVVSIGFTASEALKANPSVSVNGHAAAFVSNAGECILL